MGHIRPSGDSPLVPRGDWPVAGALVLMAVILFWRAALGGQTLFERDVHLTWYTAITAAVQAVKGGHWPFWNPAVSFGQPLWADANAQLLYPLTWLNLLMPPLTYYTLYVLLHVSATGFGMHLLSRELGASRLGAFTAAAVWMLSGPLLSTVNMPNQLGGAALLPWAVLAGVRALSVDGARGALWWSAVAAGQILAGSPEALLMAAVATLALALRPGAAGARTVARRLLRTGGLAAVLAVLISAAQWLPALGVARDSVRWRLAGEARAYWSVHPAVLLQAVLPTSLAELAASPALNQLLFEAREPLLHSVYLGLASVPLVLAALAGGGRLRLLLGSLVLLAGLFALGRHTPFYEALLTVCPPLTRLRYPSKALLLAAFAWALLAGRGLDAWRTVHRRRWTLVAAAAAMALAIGFAAAAAFLTAGAAVPQPRPETLLPAVLGSLARHGVVAGVSALFVLAAAARYLLGPAPRPAWVALLSLGPIVDLFAAHLGLNPTAPHALLGHRPPLADFANESPEPRLFVDDYLVPGRSARYLGRSDPYRIDKAPQGWSVAAARALALRLYIFPPSGAPWGIDGSYDVDVPGIDPPLLAFFKGLVYELEETPARLRLLQMGAVTHVVSLHRQPGLAPALERQGLFVEPMLVAEVPDTLPRTFAVGTTRIASNDDESARVLLDPSFDLRHAALLAEGPTLSASPSFLGTSRILHRLADSIAIEARASEPACVVMVEAFDPAWRATVGGRAAPVRRANGLYRAVCMDAGRHRVDLRYRPASVPFGLGLSVGGLALAAVLARRATPKPEGAGNAVA